MAGPTFLYDLEVGLESQKVGNHCPKPPRLDYWALYLQAQFNLMHSDARDSNRNFLKRQFYKIQKYLKNIKLPNF